MRKFAIIFLLVVSALGIIVSAAWIALYAYIGFVSLVHGEILFFFKDISRENTPLLLFAAAAVLIVSAIVFMKSRRVLKSG